MQLGAAEFDPARGELRGPDGPIRLTGGEAALLAALARKPNEVLSREDIAAALQMDDAGERAIDVQVTRLAAQDRNRPAGAALPAYRARPWLCAEARHPDAPRASSQEDRAARPTHDTQRQHCQRNGNEPAYQRPSTPAISVCLSTAGTSVTWTQDAGYDWEICEGCGFRPVDRGLSFEDEMALQDADSRSRLHRQLYPSNSARNWRARRQRLRLITRHVKHGKFLDVGSNYGFMTETARRAGFDATGLEINPGLVEHARKTFRSGASSMSPLETFNGERRTVRCRVLLGGDRACDRSAALCRGRWPDDAQRGVLLLTTPHIREYRRRGYTNMKAPDHKLYFDNATLRRLLLECGFHRVRFRFNPFKGIVLTAFKA